MRASIKVSAIVGLVVSVFVANCSGFSVGHASPKAIPSIDLVLGTQDMLRLPTDSIVTNNNVRITRSDIVFTRGDQRTLVDTIQDMVHNSHDQDDKTLANSIRMGLGIKRHHRDADMKTAYADTNAVGQQIRSILGCRRDSSVMMRKCIRALVRMKMPATSYDADTDAASAVAKGSSLRQSRMQKDVYYAKPRTDKKAHSGDTDGDMKVKDDDGELAEDVASPYRVAFRYSRGNSFRYGWRYPITYWNNYGHRIYPGTCGYGRVIGPYYYC